MSKSCIFNLRQLIFHTQGDNETDYGVIPIVRYNGNEYAIADENCSARLMNQRIKVLGTKTCPTCSNG